MQKKEIQIVEVEKEVTQERVVTIVKERPDGSKETIITENRDVVKDTSKNTSETLTTPVKPKWQLGISRAINEETYTGQISYRVLGDLWVGAYGRSDREIGLLIQYQF